MCADLISKFRCALCNVQSLCNYNKVCFQLELSSHDHDRKLWVLVAGTTDDAVISDDMSDGFKDLGLYIGAEIRITRRLQYFALAPSYCLLNCQQLPRNRYGTNPHVTYRIFHQ
jgi:hypothetical protein